MFSKRKTKILLINFLLIAGGCIAYSQPGGFLDKKNEISLNLFEITEFKINTQYKYSFHRHISLWLNFGIQSFENSIYRDIKDANGDVINQQAYGTYKGSSYEYGGGLLFNLPVTGMPMPLGNYFGVCFVVENSPGHTETIDSTHIAYKYSNKANSIRFLFGREMYLAKNFILDLSFSLGVSVGSLDYSNSNSRPPDYILPINTIFDFNSYNLIGRNDYNSFYCKPAIKIGYLF